MKQTAGWLCALVCLGVLAFGAWQGSPTTGNLPDSGVTIPASCSAPQIYFQTGSGGSGAGLYQCNAGTFQKLSTSAGAAAWGSITGTLSNQTDLQTALNLLAPLASPTFTGTIGGAAETLTGIFTVSANGALSASAINFTGTPITGGTATTTFPLIYLNSGAAPSSWSTSGTVLGINAPSGFTGNTIDIHTNGGGSNFSVGVNGAVTSTSTISGGTLTSTGPINLAAASPLTWLGRARFNSPADGVIQATNNAQTGFTRLDLGLTTSSGPALGISGTTITAQLGDGTAGGIFAASKYATVSPCSNGASPAVCSAASSGTVAVPTGTNPTLVINTTAITASSQVFLQIDESATISATTCNTTLSTLVQPVVTARTAATSFTIQIGAIIATNPACVHYMIYN